MTVIAPARPEHVDTHRHTPSCFWDLHDARWRCARAVEDPEVFPRLPRALVEPRRPPARRAGAVAHPVRDGREPGLDDGC